jgi:hypothetical protein
MYEEMVEKQFCLPSPVYHFPHEHKLGYLPHMRALVEADSTALVLFGMVP